MIIAQGRDKYKEYRIRRNFKLICLLSFGKSAEQQPEASHVNFFYSSTILGHCYWWLCSFLAFYCPNSSVEITRTIWVGYILEFLSDNYTSQRQDLCVWLHWRVLIPTFKTFAGEATFPAQSPIKKVNASKAVKKLFNGWAECNGRGRGGGGGLRGLSWQITPGSFTNTSAP